MRRKETAIEVKVGALVLVALALFVGFVFILGDFSFGESFRIYVKLENAGGLKPGADVRIAGIPAGRIESVDPIEGEYDEELDKTFYVQVTVNLDPNRAGAVGANADLVITTLGVLGEPYIEIVNDTPPGPPVEEDAVFYGDAPVRMDQLLRTLHNGLQNIDGLVDTIDDFFKTSDLGRLLTEAADLADHLDNVVVDNRESLQGTITNLEAILEENRDRIGPILENIEGATGEFEQVGRGLSHAVGDGESLRGAIDGLDTFISAASEHADETFADIAGTMDSLERIISQNEESVSNSLANVEVITDNLSEASAEANDLIAYVNSGRGTLGALLRDDELYDDLREFIRELKRRPWRLIWKE